MTKGVTFLVTVALLALASSLTSAYDPSPLQDFCVAINNSNSAGQTNALAFSSLSSQNPGIITIANAVFGSNPPINPDVLSKAFQLDQNVVNYLQKQF
uniref:Cupin type-1 domain-containing protein n=1 Tax=Fagus sylvatica TaxID=28930 RepID=A0A2N9GQN3_FAGSY